MKVISGNPVERQRKRDSALLRILDIVSTLDERLKKLEDAINDKPKPKTKKEEK